MDGFWSKVDVRGPEECWEWTSTPRTLGGYGVFRFRGQNTTAHRAAYQIAVGAVGPGQHIDHLCRNRLCCNPLHLEPVSPAENARRGLRGAMKVNCDHGHEFTSDSTGRTKQGRRFCLICRRARDRKRRDAAFWRAYRLKVKVNG